MKDILCGVLMGCLPLYAGAADNLGRLFTTPAERAALEKARHAQPVVEIMPEIVFEEETPSEEDRPDIGGITLNGLVYRKNGRSTAWVNQANSYEGNLGNQYIQIDARNIDPDKVEILIPVTETSVKLKAGESYFPDSGNNDISEDQIDQ